jgi:predicted O-methyltransferase YrrM
MGEDFRVADTDTGAASQLSRSENTVKLSQDDIKLLAESIANAIHMKFRSPNFQLDVLSRLPYSQDTANYIIEHMGKALKVEGKEKHLRFALKGLQEGLICEFGVFKGQSINWLAAWFPDRTIHGFDSFEGLPGDWTGYNVPGSHFDQKGAAPNVADNVRLHKGWFSETLPGFLADNPGPVAFIHIDCDLYSSTKDALFLLAPRIQPGTIIAFDEYHNYPLWREHEHKALVEFCLRHAATYTYITYNNIAAAIRIDTIRNF